MKRTLIILLSAVALFGLTSLVPAEGACVSTGGTCPGVGGGDRGDGFGGGGGSGGTGGEGAGRPNISIKNVAKLEGTSQNETALTVFKLTVVLSHASNGVVKVDYATSPGSASSGDDYLDESGTVSFPAGTTTKKITINVRPDFQPEEDEQFFVTLSNAKGGNIKDGSGTATILNDDTNQKP